jgi:phosphatidylserine/phosphatidylglycerophosphate/cardiolipin synthase-like enzyme
MRRRSILLPLLVMLAALAVPTALPGCRSVPVIEPELSDETFETVPQRGTSALWERQWELAVAEGATRVGLLDHGDEALALRINLIRSARESIRIQTFIWAQSESGRLILWELARAVRQRGVRVQVLADHLLSSKNVDAVAALSRFDPLLEGRVYGPVAGRLYPGSLGVLTAGLADFDALNYRMHNKLMIVDDRIAITGGRNVANEYFDRAIGMNFKDRDVLVIGPAVEAASRSFQEYWDSPRTVDVGELTDVAECAAQGRAAPLGTRGDFRLNRLFPTMSERADDPAYVRRTFIEPLHSVDRVEWIADHPLKYDDATPGAPSVTVERLTTFVRGAERSVLIQSPYLVLQKAGIEMLRELRSEKPDLRITVSTNSLAATDAWPSYAASYQQKRIYLQDLGMRIWEFRPIPQDIHRMMAYQPLLDRMATPAEARALRGCDFDIDPRLEPYPVVAADGAVVPSDRRVNEHTKEPPYLCLHAKSIVFDDRLAFIGSYNISPRSANFNTEVGLLVDDAQFAAALRRSIERDMALRNSYLVAEREYFMPLDEISEAFHKVSEALPIDLWPLRHAGSFEVREGMQPVPAGDPRFHEHWKDVGSFPLVKPLSPKQVNVRLFKIFGPLLFPFL